MSSENIIATQQFTGSMLREFFEMTQKMPNLLNGRLSSEEESMYLLPRKRVVLLFFEPSSRTFGSFAAAADALGVGIIPIVNPKFSSMAKGESLSDTLRVFGGYGQVIVLRHKDSEEALKALPWSKVPVINAGFGAGQHPTQSLVDWYTIWDHFGREDNLTLTMVGDLKYGRTVHSLAYMATKFNGVKLNFISPPELRMPEIVKKYLTTKGVSYFESSKLDEAVLKGTDVLYDTRIQREKFPNEAEYRRFKGTYIVTPDIVEMMPPRSIVLHPLPRVDEIHIATDSLPQARYFDQSDNGVIVRMAALLRMLKPELFEEFLIPYDSSMI